MSNDSVAEIDAQRMLDALLILFPPFKELSGGGWLDQSIGDMQGAVIDMERTGKCDETCLRSLKRALRKIGEAERLLGREFKELRKARATHAI